MATTKKAVATLVALSVLASCLIGLSMASLDPELTEIQAMRTILNRWLGSAVVDHVQLPVVSACEFAVTGITCSKDGRVIGISFAGKTLGGAIPEELGAFSALVYLELSRSSLQGTIPASLARLPNLETLILDDNNLYGVLPDFEGAFPALQRLSVENTRIQLCPAPIWMSSVASCCVSRSALFDCSFAYSSCAATCKATRREDAPPPPADPPVKAPGSAKFSNSQIAGIAVGVAIGILIIILVIFFAVSESKRRTTPETTAVEMPRRFGANDSASRRELSVAHIDRSKTSEHESFSSKKMEEEEPEPAAAPSAPPKKKRKRRRPKPTSDPDEGKALDANGDDDDDDADE